MWRERGAWRGAPIAALPKEARRGAQTEIAMMVREESRPGTPPMTGEEGTESGIAETTEREVWVCFILSLCIVFDNIILVLYSF